MEASKFLMTGIIFRFFLVLISLIVNSTVYPQHKSVFPEINAQIQENYNYLRKNVIMVGYDMIPYSENGKWGIKKKDQSIFLPAVYDSIINADTKFITVKGSEYQLIDYNLWNWFDSTVTSIYYFNKIFTVKDQENRISKYQIIDDYGRIFPVDGSINHLRYNLNPKDLWVDYYKTSAEPSSTKRNYRDEFSLKIVQPYDTFSLYFKEKLIRQFPNKGTMNIGSFAFIPNTDNGIICIETRSAKGKMNYKLITSKGKLLAESKYEISCWYYEKFHQIQVAFYTKVRFDQRTAIYHPETESFQFIPYNNNCWEQIDDSVILYSDYYAHKKHHSTSLYFLDLHGNCIANDKVFSDNERVIQLNKETLLELTYDHVPSIYNRQLKQICDSCYFSKQTIRRSETTNDLFFVVHTSMNDPFVQVFNQNMELVFPDRYLAAIYTGGYFAVLTKDHQVKYIPLTN